MVGDPEGIDLVENTLNRWAAQLEGRPAWVRQQIYGRDGLLVLGGVVPVLTELLGAEKGAPPVSEAESACMSEDLLVLESEGWLRRHQVVAVEAALWAPLGRGIIEVPTGGGKTRIAAAIGAVRGGVWLYVVPNEELLQQSEKTFVEANELLGDSVEWHVSTYGRLQGLVQREYTGVVFDECHLIGASTRALGAASVHRADYRLGLSGSPLDRCDDKNTLVIGLCGPVVYKISIPDLQEDGYLAQGEVKVIEVRHED